MKTALDCLPCLLRQALRVARLQRCDERKQQAIMKSVAHLISEFNFDNSPPDNAVAVYEAIAGITGCQDPYLEVKREENLRALEHLPFLRHETQIAEAPLAAAIGFAIAGNIIDYGAAGRFDIEEAFRKSREVAFAIDNREKLLARVADLQPGSKVLYLADNCGEIVYDSLVIELLAEANLDIIVAVKDAPIINDALLEDAYVAGLDRFARILSNGTACPGTCLHKCSREFLDVFESAELVISKGQGNFETLSEVDRELFFLLTVKCKMVGKHLAEISGSAGSLPGDGEMVVYHSRKKDN
jgi:uncharacterized protein with ATP-grasp and redox domains